MKYTEGVSIKFLSPTLGLDPVIAQHDIVIICVKMLFFVLGRYLYVFCLEYIRVCTLCEYMPYLSYISYVHRWVHMHILSYISSVHRWVHMHIFTGYCSQILHDQNYFVELFANSNLIYSRTKILQVTLLSQRIRT